MCAPRYRFRPVLFLCLLLLAVISGQPAVAESLVFASADSPPFVDEGEGFYERLMAELGRRTGFDITVERMPSERGLLEAAAGRVDGELGRIEGIEESYPTLVRVPTPLTDWDFVAFSRVERLQPLTSFDDLAGLRVAYINGWKIYEANVPDRARAVVTNDEDQLFQVLLSGRVDLALYSAARGAYWIRTHPQRQLFRVPGALARRQMYLYLNEEHRELVPLFADTLAQIIDSDWLTELRAETLERME